MRRLVVGGPQGEPDAAAAQRRFAEVLHAVIDGFWALMLPVIIIVGLRFGIFTPTEAARRRRGLFAVRRDLHLPRTEVRRSSMAVFVSAARDHQRRDVPGRRSAGVVLADHGGRDFRRRSWTCCKPLHGQQHAADVRDHGASW